MSDVSQARALQELSEGYDAARPSDSALEWISSELQRAQTEILSLRQVLANARLDSDRTISDLRAEVERHKREILKLNGELAIAAHDRRLNVTQMVHAMIAAERRLRGAGSVAEDVRERYDNILKYVDNLRGRYQELRHRVDELTQERDAAKQTLREITSSVSWRAIVPLRHLARSNPSAAQASVRTLKFAWRALKLRSMVRFFRTGQFREDVSRLPRNKVPGRSSSKSGPARSKSEKLAPPDPFALPVALLSRTGVQGGVSADCLDPWPADRPLVSVVIPCFNYSHFVAEAVQSVLDQTFRDLEIIVVEGGSSSLEARQELAEMELPRTRILLQPEAHRAGANRNFGISHARGKYMLSRCG
ncbi:glycosyltransferase [Microvirga aerilata]|uniref:glycosyltransferase family 2 protein n=1 Tax=Microvirga aerilata TaxID=670292 RepID=UPI00363B9D0B